MTSKWLVPPKQDRRRAPLDESLERFPLRPVRDDEKMGEAKGSMAAMVMTRDACPRRASLKKTVVALILTIFAQATGNIFLSMKMKEIGSNDWSVFLARAVGSPTLWFGTALLIVSFIFFAAALSWADLSFVVPAVSAEVVVNVFCANYFLEEVVSLTRWMGVLLISVGVILVLRSEKKKKAHRESEEIPTRGDC